MERAFFKMKDQCKVSRVRISLTVKNSENMVKSDACDGERQLLFEMNEGYKVSCVKVLIFF